MLTLNDFLHLPQLDPLLDRILAQQAGLVVIAGPDPRPKAESRPPDSSGAPYQANDYLIRGSGRESLLRVLLDGLLDRRPQAHALVVSTRPQSFHLPKRLKKQAEILTVESDSGYAAALARALATRPQIVALEKLDSESLPLALQAATRGTLVLAGLDSIFYGPGAARYLQELSGLPGMPGLSWIVSVQRLEALCSACRKPAEADAALQESLQAHLQPLSALPAGVPQPGMQTQLAAEIYQRSMGCPACQMTGCSGEVLLFDIYAQETGNGLPGSFPASLLPMTSYAAGLAAQGRVDLRDALELSERLSRRAFLALQDSERRLASAQSGLGRRRAELESAQRVLEQRTRSLVTFQEIGQALTAGEALEELAQRVCRRASELCGAEQAVLYYLRRKGQAMAAQVLAATGWGADASGGFTALKTLPLKNNVLGPLPYLELPPGLRLPAPRESSAAPGKPSAGIAIPLLVQSAPVGLMVIQSSSKSSFSPGDLAMLETYAHQAALALQRSALIEELRARVVELEAAQEGLAQKERLEHELELARQVQQALLPAELPQFPRFQAAASCLPARQVGGDFYDLFELDSDHIGLAIGDVSDKGMPAALYMALTRSLLRAEAARSMSPAAVLQRVNRLLLELGRPELFVTVFYGVVERSTLRLSYARAGHDRPVLLRGKELYELDGEGIPLGLFLEPEFQLKKKVINLEPGDRLLLYTDGLCDALDPNGQEFSRSRLLSLLQAAAGLEPHALCREVLDRILDFQAGAEQYDDITLMALHVSGAE